jgi:hypothetical protein
MSSDLRVAARILDEAAYYVRPSTPRRRAFIKHLELVSKALFAIDKVDEDDCSPGYEDEYIEQCYNFDVGECYLAEMKELVKLAGLTC